MKMHISESTMNTKKINFPEVSRTCSVMHHDNILSWTLKSSLLSNAETSQDVHLSLSCRCLRGWVLGEVAGPELIALISLPAPCFNGAWSTYHPMLMTVRLFASLVFPKVHPTLEQVRVYPGQGLFHF